MPIEPDGPLSLPLGHLRTLVAASGAFQSWTETSDADAAKERIFLVGPPPEAAEYTLQELQALRPFAVVDLWTPRQGYGGQPYRTEREGHNAFQEAGKLTLDLIDDVIDEEAGDFASSKIRFLNRVGGVISDLVATQGQDVYLSVHAIELYQGPILSDEEKVDEQGRFWRAQFLVHWGI